MRKPPWQPRPPVRRSIHQRLGRSAAAIRLLARPVRERRWHPQRLSRAPRGSIPVLSRSCRPTPQASLLCRRPIQPPALCAQILSVPGSAFGIVRDFPDFIMLGAAGSRVAFVCRQPLIPSSCFPHLALNEKNRSSARCHRQPQFPEQRIDPGLNTSGQSFPDVFHFGVFL